MTATTIEQLITTHGPMIARLYGHDVSGFTTAQFTDTIASLGRTYATGATENLKVAAEHLTAVANYLVDAELDPVAAGGLIAHADQRLQLVNNLTLA
jgi:hypothetical protein